MHANSLDPTAIWRRSVIPSPTFARTATPSRGPAAKRLGAAAKRFLAKALGGASHPAPRVINTDKHAAYPPAIVELKADDVLKEHCEHRPVQYLNNVLEQDHRAIKRRINASQHFRSFWAAWRTISGYEAIHMTRKGQACWSARVGLLQRFILDLFAATS
jgi:transposase-like protein